MTPDRDLLIRQGGSAVTETVEQAYEGVGSDELWHVCSTHSAATDPPCGPGCKYFCGLPVTWDCMDVVETEDDTGICVVCLDLSGRAHV